MLLPEPIPGSGSSRSNSGSAGPLPRRAGERRKPPSRRLAREGRDASDSGCPGYAQVKEGWRPGRKPTLDGFDALKQAGFRTVIYLHPAGADLSAAKDVAAKRGAGLRRASRRRPRSWPTRIEQFNAVVADTARHPLYVFDDDGVRAGAMWYLHFRTAEAMNDDAARVRARPLGLTEQGDEAKAFALATQRYLELR